MYYHDQLCYVTLKYATLYRWLSSRLYYSDSFITYQLYLVGIKIIAALTFLNDDELTLAC